MLRFYFLSILDVGSECFMLPIGVMVYHKKFHIDSSTPSYRIIYLTFRGKKLKYAFVFLAISRCTDEPQKTCVWYLNFFTSVNTCKPMLDRIPVPATTQQIKLKAH